MNEQERPEVEKIDKDHDNGIIFDNSKKKK